MKRAACLIFLLSIFNCAVKAQCADAYDHPEDISNDHRTYLSNYPGATSYGHPDSIFYNLDKSGGKFDLGFSRGIWVAAFDQDRHIMAAISTYPEVDRKDYGVGPVDLNGDFDAERCSFFSRVWKVTQIEVFDLIEAYKRGDLTRDNIPLAVLEWPAKGNPYIGSYAPEYDMAPFYDNDQNDQYDPLKGDYPIALVENTDFIPFEFKFSVYNDNIIHRELFYDALGMEFHQIDFLINCSEERESEHAAFTRIKYINHDDSPLLDFKLGIWNDTDLGCAFNDYIGCNKALNCTYTYNNQGVDTTNCVQFLDDNLVPLGTAAIASVVYLNEEMKSFITVHPPEMRGSDSRLDFYSLLSGQWTTTDLMTYGGTGFNPISTDTTKFIFPGRPDKTSEWSMQQEDISNGDYRTITSLVHKDLEPGEAGIIDFADYVFTNKSDSSLESFDEYEVAVRNLKAQYEAIKNGDFECGGAYVICTEDCVWPGDVDNDFMVNGIDLVKLGNFRGLGIEQGPPRNFISNDWHPFNGKEWQERVFNIDAKHADVNGSGYIDKVDLEVAAANFGRGAKNNQVQYLEPEVKTDNLITSIYEDIPNRSFFDFSVRIGEYNQPLSEPIHGLSFQMKYDTSKLMLTPGLVRVRQNDFQFVGHYIEDTIPYYVNNRVFTGGNKLHYYYTNLNGVEQSKGGSLVTQTIDIREDARTNNSDGKDTVVIKLYNVFATNSVAELLDLGAIYDTLFLDNLIYDPTLLSATETVSEENSLTLFPNPSDTELHISFDKKVDGVLRVFSSTGKQVEIINFESRNRITLDVSAYQIGLYLVCYQNENGSLASSYFTKL